MIIVCVSVLYIWVYIHFTHTHAHIRTYIHTYIHILHSYSKIQTFFRSVELLNFIYLFDSLKLHIAEIFYFQFVIIIYVLITKFNLIWNCCLTAIDLEKYINIKCWINLIQKLDRFYYTRFDRESNIS